MPERESPYKRAGFASEDAYRKARRQAQQWSDRHSRSEQSRYRRDMKPEEFRAYFNAYASNATGITARRRRARSSERRHLGPSKYVKHYLVKVARYYSPEDFDGRYSELR